jgi:hypothetical protein
MQGGRSEPFRSSGPRRQQAGEFLSIFEGTAADEAATERIFPGGYSGRSDRQTNQQPSPKTTSMTIIAARPTDLFSTPW